MNTPFTLLLNHWFSNYTKHQNNLEGDCQNTLLDPLPEFPIYQVWDENLRVCILTHSQVMLMLLVGVHTF